LKTNSEFSPEVGIGHRGSCTGYDEGLQLNCLNSIKNAPVTAPGFSFLVCVPFYRVLAAKFEKWSQSLAAGCLTVYQEGRVGALTVGITNLLFGGAGAGMSSDPYHTESSSLAVARTHQFGVVAGLRSLTAPAIVAWAAHRNWLNLHNTPLSFIGSIAAVVIFTLLAVVELVADQLPSTPVTGFPPSCIRLGR